ncbi:hypothetical protein [Egicoccus halophilus]|uniref:Uncharacterized protein n=1 Tax=Egicoccus halophilus TaxID=1670830 RepID=A0A8J3EYX1_9ACTN|nr:hypothetical protein [Egicoccus halophilus]GGI08713.1 hypothetical protein GCM10011354_30470 [Egicoccus halophilus]
MTTPFDELPPAEADAIVARFVAARPQALADLRDRLVTDGQDPDALLDGSVDSLVPLWAWGKRHLRRRDDGLADTEAEPFAGQSVPEWYRHDTHRERLLSLDSVRLLDGVLTYVGEVVRRAVPGVAWRRGHHEVRAYAHRNRPVIGRGDEEVGAGPMVFGAARSHLLEPGSSPDGQLRGFVDRWVERLRAADAGSDERLHGESGPPPVAVLDDVVVSRGVEADEWVVEFGDDARALVGQAVVERLADTLPGNAGVTAATFEDREVLVVSGSVDPGELERFVVAELFRDADPA